MKKILLIEDDHSLLRALQAKITESGYNLKTADNGDEGQNLVDSFKPDLILLDIIMPKKSGLDVLKELKSNQRTKNIPVIVLTNLDTDETISTAMTLGAIDYITKAQVNINDLMNKIGIFFTGKK